MPVAAEEAIQVRGLRKSFGALAAVDGIDLDVHAGEIFGLVGPDGAGKTTIMRLLTGILDADAGHIQVAGCDVVRQPEAMKRHIGYVPQRFGLYGDLTVAENLTFYANIYHVARTERLERERVLLEFSRLAPFRNRLAQHLSGGMRQKLSLACALIHTPRVLFLDEPTTGVDPVSRRELWNILYSLLREGVTLFVSTPYMDEAERCNRVALIDKGRIARCDTPEALKADMRGDVLEVVVASQREASAVLATVPTVRGVQVFGDRLHVRVADADRDATAIIAALAARELAVDSVRPTQPGLEDVFISMLESGEA